jgi:hypothetical protein
LPQTRIEFTVKKKLDTPQRMIGSLIAIAIAFAVAAVVPQAQTAAPASKPVPRAANGRPDLSGIWIANGALRLMAGDEEVKRIQQADAAAGRKPLPPPEPPPYKPEAEARRQEYLARRGIDDPMARCLLTGVPRISFRPLPFQIVQLPDQVIILYEIHHAFRIIPTDGRPHPGDLEPSYLGESVGKWEGDTLVVDVVGFNDKTWLAGVGSVHSEKLRVTERYTRDSYDTIRYDVTMEDPEVFTKPWTMHEIFRLRPGERIREYECIEDNEDLQRIEKLLKDESIFRRPKQ